MEWTQFILFAISVFGLFIWNRTESRNDNRHLQDMISDHDKFYRDILKEIKEENKDFHGRLCELEERSRNMHGI